MSVCGARRCIAALGVVPYGSVYQVDRSELPLCRGVMNDASNKSDTGGLLHQHDQNEEDDGVVQRDDEQRFIRYSEQIGAGRFKVVYKGFDERNGLDVAWVIISGDQLGLDLPTLMKLLTETQRNTKLKHKHIIRCFKCWKSENQINLVTEIFTSGNLREFIQEHNQLGPDALRKFSKQILEGIDYLHSQDPPVVHGDLRCDKIYVNGNEGTVKIGDLGLVTLLTRRYAHSPPSSNDVAPETHVDGVRHSPEYDILSFGMCMLEMYTQVRSPLVHVQWSLVICSYAAQCTGDCTFNIPYSCRLC